ncbi:hypothetical protein L0657_18290 [Dyadobacter sp. CY345]|uniref:hypothetical protein n=1 Tax=Dyadobacter sp. CY345 TaxID=2909335 RepID=UPI001F2B9891|nr:hypothetical protein [Dyadobacter sp. CY345]MCF2445917.1 hypothetical protein [Dyadobacter sp. CY345]
MKHFVLFFLLVLFPEITAKAQESKAREIVGLALKAHTSGKKIERFEVYATYDKPSKAPASLHQPDPFLNFVDSLMKTLPDSIQKEMAAQKIIGDEELFKTIEEEHAGVKELNFVDLPLKIIASTSVRPNRLRGNNDTTSTLFDFKDSYLLSIAFKFNPVILLHVMEQDSTQLHYIGKATIDNQDYFLVQVRVVNKWLEVYFDAKSYLMSRLSEPLVDEDPLIGQGPLLYSHITSYKNYELRNSFLLPTRVEETNTNLPFTNNKLITWVSINKVFPASVFDPPLTYEEKIKFSFEHIGDNLFVMEEKASYLNSRSKIRTNSDNTIDIFTNLSNNDLQNKKELKAINLQFKNPKISNIYSSVYLSGFSSLSCFFSKEIHIKAPKATGIFADQNTYGNPVEDSVQVAVRARGLLTTFDQDFETETEKAFILNPSANQEHNNIWVAYYLKNNKVIYLEGYAHKNLKNENNTVAPGEIALMKLIQSKSLDVEKIVFSKSFTDDAPLFVTFAEFEKRVKNSLPSSDKAGKK